MKELKEKIISLLSEAFGYPVIQLSTIESEEAIPEDYFTFRIDSSSSRAFDNMDILTAWDININFFSVDPERANTIPLQARALLKSNGFIPQGKGYDLISDNSDYSGWYMDFYFIEI